MSQVKHISYYTNVVTNWSRELGNKPTEAQLALAHVFGRPGKQSLAVAMALRDGGVTGNQIKQASALFDGKPTPQLNHMRDLIKAKSFTREAVPGAYAITLAPNGQKFVDLHGARAMAAAEVKVIAKAAAVKPVKAKKAAAPRKPKAVKPVEVVVPVEVPADQPTA